MHEGCRRKPRGVQTSPGNGWLMGSKHRGPPKERWEAAGCSSRAAAEKGAAGEGQVLRSLGAGWGLM